MIFIVSGPGGVGKDTVVRRVLERDPTLELSRSWTTRPPRPGETEADYHFVSAEQFSDNIQRGGFFEWAEYLGHMYGTPIPEVAQGADVVLVIEVQGAAQVLAKAADAVMILIEPPSMDALAARMRARGDSEERIAARLGAADQELSIGRGLAQHVVVNDDVGRAATEVAGILASHRKTPS